MILNPYVTEKATVQAEKNNVLQFIVNVEDTKSKVKKELEALYKVKVHSVNMMMTPKGKKRPSWYSKNRTLQRNLPQD